MHTILIIGIPSCIRYSLHTKLPFLDYPSKAYYTHLHFSLAFPLPCRDSPDTLEQIEQLFQKEDGFSFCYFSLFKKFKFSSYIKVLYIFFLIIVPTFSLLFRSLFCTKILTFSLRHNYLRHCGAVCRILFCNSISLFTMLDSILFSNI